MKRMALPIVVTLTAGLTAAADIRLAPCFGNNMVLQRDVPARISGSADAGSTVTVAFAGQKKSVTAGADGAWRVMLDPMAANSTPQRMTITAPISNLRSEISNILVGDVWVCSGQSNMRMTVLKGPWCNYGGVSDGEAEAAAANYPEIRLRQNFRGVRQELPGTDWDVCTPETAKMFSAAGYFFARELHKQLNVPIGIVEGSLGGSSAEQWAPRAALFDAAEIASAEQDFNELKSLADEDRKAGGAWKREYDAAKKDGKPLPLQPTAKLTGEDRKRFAQAARIHYAGNNYGTLMARYTWMPIKGVIWYQGESQKDRADKYPALMKRLIAAWRKAWGQEFPFLIMQLVNFGPGPGAKQPPFGFVEVRQAQQEIADTVPGVGIAVGIDIGVTTEIHPPNKQEVGRRLALVALKQVYGRDVVASGPTLKDARFEAGRAILSFDPGGKDQRLILKESVTNGFELAGADGAFVPAAAEVKDTTVSLTAQAVREPRAVRYAWYDNPPATLFNSDGLPAAPFRRAIDR
jgi:sialate O-acetylesterase